MYMFSVWIYGNEKIEIETENLRLQTMPLVYFILHLTTQAPFPYINTILAKGV
jgi:hypothetical protein